MPVDFMSQNRHFMEHEQPHTSVDFNPMSLLAFFPAKGLRISAQETSVCTMCTNIHIYDIFAVCLPLESKYTEWKS